MQTPSTPLRQGARMSRPSHAEAARPRVGDAERGDGASPHRPSIESIRRPNAPLSRQPFLDEGAPRTPVPRRVPRVLAICGVSMHLLWAGCATTAELRIVPREIPPLTADDDDQRLCAVLANAIDSQAADVRIQEPALRLTANGHPGVIATMVIQVENWANTDERLRVLETISHACLDSADPMVRWSGIHAARRLPDSGRGCAAMEADVPSLVLRPDYQGRQGSFIDWAQPAVALASVRADLIRLVAECNLRESEGVLNAIVSDHGEWHEATRAAVAESLTLLKRSVGERQEHH
jgi:hypothetical protein